MHAGVVVTDAKGSDLLTGHNRSDLLRDTQTPRFFRNSPRAHIVARRSPNGQYWFFLMVTAPTAGPGYLTWPNPSVVGQRC